jgi:cation transport regulator ChaC
MPDPSSGHAYVFGYASLVGLREPFAVGGAERRPIAGRLRGHRRHWGAAMDNWDSANDHKHFVEPGTGERPHLRVAYLDVEADEGGTVNGLAIPVDAARLAVLDAREVNYSRVDVSSAFEPAIPQRVFTYVGTAAARERCRRGAADGNLFASRDYVAATRRAFELLAPDALAEFDRTTEPLPFPERDLKLVWPSEGA